LYLCTSTPIIPNLKQKQTQFFTPIGYALKIILKLKNWNGKDNKMLLNVIRKSL
jgi:hypothetical protein